MPLRWPTRTTKVAGCRADERAACAHGRPASRVRLQVGRGRVRRMVIGVRRSWVEPHSLCVYVLGCIYGQDVCGTTARRRRPCFRPLRAAPRPRHAGGPDADYRVPYRTCTPVGCAVPRRTAVQCTPRVGVLRGRRPRQLPSSLASSYLFFDSLQPWYCNNVLLV